MRPLHSRLIRCVPILLIFWLMLTYQIAAPYFNSRDVSRVWIPSAVRNLEIYGTDQIGLMIVRTAYEEDDLSKLEYYSHHPPLLVWLPALITKFAGFNELAMRFISPIAMMIAAAGFYTLVKQLYKDNNIAFWSLILFAIPPLNSTSQAAFVHEALGWVAIVLFALIFVKWFPKPSLRHFIGLILMSILATWTAWPAVIFVGVIGIFGMIFGNWRHRLGVIILGIISIVSIAIMLLLYELWWSGAITDLINSFFWRASAASTTQDSEAFTLIEWLTTLIYHMFFYATVAVVVLSFIGIRYLRNEGSRFANAFTMTLLISGVLYLLVFRNAGHVHGYYKAFLLPALAISGAMAIIHWRKSANRFAKPVVDGLIISFLVQTIFVFSSSYSVPHQENLENIIDYINHTPNLPEEIYVVHPSAFYKSDKAIEFYTNRNIEWNILLQDLPSTNDKFLYIVCYDDQHYMEDLFDELPPHTQLDEQCTAYELTSN